MKVIANQNGFTYILALTVIMITGIMLGMIGQSWKSIKQRELEEEMIFRGDQIVDLINQKIDCSFGLKTPSAVNQFLWTINSPNGTVLDDLVIGKEVNCRGTKKLRLRPSAIIDPVTNKQWKIVSPVGDTTRFAGVTSESTDEPFRKSFKEIYESQLLDGKKQYSEWLFTWELKTPVLKTGKTQ